MDERFSKRRDASKDAVVKCKCGCTWLEVFNLRRYQDVVSSIGQELPWNDSKSYIMYRCGRCGDEFAPPSLNVGNNTDFVEFQQEVTPLKDGQEARQDYRKLVPPKLPNDPSFRSQDDIVRVQLQEEAALAERKRKEADAAPAEEVKPVIAAPKSEPAPDEATK